MGGVLSVMRFRIKRMWTRVDLSHGRSTVPEPIRRFFGILVECGASPDIGSDVLEELVPALRNRIVELGGSDYSLPA